MLSVAPRVDAEVGSEVAYGRYRVEQVLGEGGMAVVYEAYDTVLSRRVALKRLRADLGHKTEALRVLFQGEFLALAQLSHPRIVAAYDYGVDARGPFYTMELLDGGDLRRIAPADYRTACSLARDICSALSLVHSRRMVFRDLSPSNVRRTSDGLGKIIDFGALAPFGPSKDMVGTFPCLPPEALEYKHLDGRSDLYSLGATLYFTLVRKHAFPARSVDELHRLWQGKPRAPSEIAPGIPAALDTLLLQLLSLDPGRRPNSAAEVIERLSAIAGLPYDESLLVEQSYLASPVIVAREEQLAEVRTLGERTLAGKGASLLVTGASGVGRSRMLEMCALEAKLNGMIVLTADASELPTSDYALARSLARKAVEQAPDLARREAQPWLSVLGALLPELLAVEDDIAQPSLDDVQSDSRRLQQGLRAWFFGIASKNPMLIAIDNIDRADTSSVALVALLARELGQHAILLLTTRNSSEHAGHQRTLQGALHLLKRVSTSVRLPPLEPHQTEQLLASVFGEVPHLPLTAQHIQRVTHGLPRDIMQLARHLVSEGTVRYEAGAWSLPQRLDASALPASMGDALDRRVRKLDLDAREVAYILCAEPNRAFTLEQLAQLSDLTTRRIIVALKELLARELAFETQGSYRTAQLAMLTPLLATLDPKLCSRTHERLAALCNHEMDRLRAIQHLYRAGLDTAALDHMVVLSRISTIRSDATSQTFLQLLRTLPEGWYELFDRGLRALASLERPEADRRAVLARLTGIIAQAEPDGDDGSEYVHMLLKALGHDVGLDLVAALPEDLDPVTRIRTALGKAGARTASLPMARRGLDPASAIKELGAISVAAIGMFARDSDYDGLRRMPSLSALAVLSPALALAEELRKAVGLRVAGHTQESIAIYDRILERLAAPDHAGLEASHHLHMGLRVAATRGVLDATMGRASCLAFAARVSQEQRYQIAALGIHKLYQLFQGNAREARKIEAQIELLRVESNDNHTNEAHYDFNELFAHALANDLTGIKRSCDALEPRAKLRVQLQAAWLYGAGERQRIRGADAAALVQFERALSLMRPGQHLLWAPAAAAHLRTLLVLDRTEEAFLIGQQYVRESRQLGHMHEHVLSVFSLVLAHRGQHEEAVCIGEEAINGLGNHGVSGLILGAAYEARAQVASLLRDDKGLRTYAALYAATCPGRRSLDATLHEEVEAAHGVANELEEADALSQLQSSLETCQTFYEHASTALEFLVRRNGASAGVLFTRGKDGLVRAAAFGNPGEDTSLDYWATEYFKREVTEHVTEMTEGLPLAVHSDQPAEMLSPPPFSPVLLGHEDARGYAFTGVALLVGEQSTQRPQSPQLVAELSRSLGLLLEVAPEYL